MDPLTPFAHWGSRAPYTTETPRFWLATCVFPVRSKSGLGTTRSGGVAHLVADMAALIYGGRARFAARWVCGGGTTYAVPIQTATPFGGVCPRCEDARTASVYRCFAQDGQLLYVGSSGSTMKRLQTHESQTPWWSEVAEVRLERFATLPEARGAERLAILAEKPLYNQIPRQRKRRLRVIDGLRTGAA